MTGAYMSKEAQRYALSEGKGQAVQDEQLGVSELEKCWIDLLIKVLRKLTEGSP